MKRKRRCLRFLLGALLLAALLWRFLPRNLYSLAGTQQDAVRRAYLTVYTYSDEEIPVYHINTEELEAAQRTQLLELLAGEGYRPSLRNLIPFVIWDSHVKGEAIGVSVGLVWSQDPEEAAHLSMLGSEVSGSQVNCSGKIYYPVDKEVLTKLRSFAAQYGVISK